MLFVWTRCIFGGSWLAKKQDKQSQSSVKVGNVVFKKTQPPDKKYKKLVPRENVCSRWYSHFQLLSPWLKDLLPVSLPAVPKIESWLCFGCSPQSPSQPAWACPRHSRQRRSPSPTRRPAPASSKPSLKSSVSSLAWWLSYMIHLALWMKMSSFSLGKLWTLTCRCTPW